MKILAALLLCAAVAPAQQYRAFWADAFHYGYKSPAEVDQMLDDAGRSHVNAIFMQVRRRADSYYHRTLEVPAQDATWSSSFDALAYLIDRAHARGIEVHAWFVVYPLWPTTIAPPVNPEHLWHKHGPRATGENMWMQVSGTGSIGGGLDPGHPAVPRYLTEVILDPINHYDFDGIHLDYIRYSEDADYGWNPAAVARFNRLNGRAGIPAANDAAWAAFRRQQVTGLVRQIYLRAVEKKPSLKVSAALISWGNGPATEAAWLLTDAYRRVFQDWRGWLEEGILDLAMPMHYFRETTNASFLDRWLDFTRARPHNRAYLPGLAIYLNSIPDSLAQVGRSLQGTSGVALYSYASSNTLNAAGLPVTPNAEFYARIGELFGGPAAIPALAWKSEPVTGHAAGTVEVAGGGAFLYDGIEVQIASDTGKDFTRAALTDATGFFGFVDLPPDRYRLRFSRGGRTVFEATPRDVAAGKLTRFDVFLRAEDFSGVQPRIQSASRQAAAPGDIVGIEGRNLGGNAAYATSVPLPTALDGTQVLFAGIPLPLFSVMAGKIEFQLPYVLPERWNIVVRRAGMDSEPFAIAAAPHAPSILGVIRRDAVLEIYATGLGMTAPQGSAGTGADPGNLPRLTEPVTVMVTTAEGELELIPLYAGLAPYLPGRYQVNVLLPNAAASGRLRLRIGGVDSAPSPF
ncbi:MAG: hypothetical protein FJW20_21875 [Acidimicrobiia bacterium]|nr:hypothetical protein [Acidimicrobiia bacterium]